MMEHRWHNRLPVRFEAELSLDGRMAALGQVRNVSRGGFYIETPGLRLLRGTMVDLHMTSPGFSGGRAKALRCLVVHSTRAGAGLLLVETGSGLSRQYQSVEAA